MTCTVNFILHYFTSSYKIVSSIKKPFGTFDSNMMLINIPLYAFCSCCLSFYFILCKALWAALLNERCYINEVLLSHLPTYISRHFNLERWKWLPLRVSQRLKSGWTEGHHGAPTIGTHAPRWVPAVRSQSDDDGSALPLMCTYQPIGELCQRCD